MPNLNEKTTKTKRIIHTNNCNQKIFYNKRKNAKRASLESSKDPTNSPLISTTDASSLGSTKNDLTIGENGVVVWTKQRGFTTFIPNQIERHSFSSELFDDDVFIISRSTNPLRLADITCGGKF